MNTCPNARRCRSVPALLFLAGAMGLSACSSYVIPEAADAEPVGVYGLNCESPWAFSRSCDGPPPWANQPIVLNGLPFNIAASDDGRIVLVERCNHTEDFCPMKSPETGHRERTDDKRGAYMAGVFETVRDTLAAEGIGVRSVTPVIASFPLSIGRRSTWGYVIELDGDGYSVLIRHAPVAVDAQT